MTVMRVNDYGYNMERISTGKRINSAADDAAGLSIVQKLNSQVAGTDQGTRNTYDMKNALQTGEGALSSIHESLQRIRELAVMSQSPAMNDDDKAALQKEVEGLKSHITETAVKTEFNSIKILDGNFADKNLASNPSGGGMKISVESMTLENLGIKDFDVTQSFSLDRIDDAISKVSTSRANMGAVSNRMDHIVNNNNVSSYNMTAARSRIEDADIARQIINMNTIKVLETYKLFMQKEQAQIYTQTINLLA